MYSPSAVRTKDKTIYRASSRRNRRVASAIKHCLEYLGSVSLITLRSTCTDNYASVNRYLRGTLHSLLRRFVPDPADFLKLLSPWGALIVGEAALSHIVQDPSICTVALEVAIGNLYFQDFLDNLSPYLITRPNIGAFVVTTAPSGFPYNRHITRIAEYRFPSGLQMVVYESSTPAASDVVCGYWTTALMNFVTGHSFNCAYPRLTLNRLTLLCDSRASCLSREDLDLARRLADRGFQSGFQCYDWPLDARGPSAHPLPPLTDCGRSLYVCPLQARYFGDPGSLVVFYDGFRVDLQELKDLCVPPYGPMVTWRLPFCATDDCSCLSDGRDMPPFTVSVLTQFMDDSRKSSSTYQPSVHGVSVLHSSHYDRTGCPNPLYRRRTI